MPSDSWQRLIVRRIVIGPVLWVGGGFFFLPETAAARLLRLCVPSGDLLAAYGLVHQRLGSGDRRWRAQEVADTTDSLRAVACIRFVRPLLFGKLILHSGCL